MTANEPVPGGPVAARESDSSRGGGRTHGGGRRIDLGPDPRELIRDLRTGDGVAFVRLFRAVAGPIAVMARGRGAEDPEGIANEVVAAVGTGIHGFSGDDETAFIGWVFRIARNKVNDDLRRSYRRVRTESFGVAELNLVDRRANVEEQLESADSVTHLLSQLTDAQQEVLVLRVLVGLSLRETAVATGRRIGAIKALQHRALDRLRELLDRDERPPM